MLIGAITTVMAEAGNGATLKAFNARGHMYEHREKYCRRCRALTRHSRTERSTRTFAFAAILGGLGAIWCLWPFVMVVTLMVMPVALLVGLARPHRCDECGRRNWRWGGRRITGREEREGPKHQYDEIRLVRQATVAREEDLIVPIERLARVILREGGRFRLYAHSPAHRLYTIRTRWWSNVWKFVTTSEIQWGHGRDPRDPTHQVMFFNWPRSIRLRVQFVLAPAESTGPGLRVRVMVRTDTAVHPRGDRSARLDRLFSRMIEIVQPDYGCVLLPEHEDESPTREPQAGWLTYVAISGASAGVSVPLPAVAVPFASGVKITATPVAPESHNEAASAIAAVRGAMGG